MPLQPFSAGDQTLSNSRGPNPPLVFSESETTDSLIYFWEEFNNFGVPANKNHELVATKISDVDGSVLVPSTLISEFDSIDLHYDYVKLSPSTFLIALTSIHTSASGSPSGLAGRYVTYRVFDKDLNPLTAELVVSYNASGNNSHLRTFLLSNGNVLLTWWGSTASPTTFTVFAAIVDKNTYTITSPKTQVWNSTASSTLPVIPVEYREAENYLIVLQNSSRPRMLPLDATSLTANPVVTVPWWTNAVLSMYPLQGNVTQYGGGLSNNLKVQAFTEGSNTFVTTTLKKTTDPYPRVGIYKLSGVYDSIINTPSLDTIVIDLASIDPIWSTIGSEAYYYNIVDLPEETMVFEDQEYNFSNQLLVVVSVANEAAITVPPVFLLVDKTTLSYNVFPIPVYAPGSQLFSTQTSTVASYTPTSRKLGYAFFGGTQGTLASYAFLGDAVAVGFVLPVEPEDPNEAPDPNPDPIEDPTPPFPGNWLSDPTFEKCLVAKIKYYDTEEKTFYFSSHEHSSIADGLLRAFIPRLAKSPTFQMSVSTSDSGMSTSVNYGSLPILNSDGKFDNWMDYGFDGRDISLYVGPVLGNVDSDFVKVFEGVVDRVVFEDNSVITLTFRDYAKKLDKPVQDSNYAEGETITFTTDTTKTVTIASSLKGQPKPLVFGEVFNIEPVLVNASYLVYQVSDEPIDAIVAVYDKGILLTPGVGYRVDLSKGILELVNNPSGVITCDVRGVLLEDNYITPSTKSYSNKLVRIIKELCYRSGIPGSKLTSTDYVANVPVGIYLKERVNALNVIDELLNSIDGFMYFDPVGSLVISTLVVPNNAIGSQIGRTTSGLSYGDIVYDQDIDTDAYIIASDTIAEEIIDYSLATLSEKHLLVKSRLPFVVGSSEITGALSVRSLNVPSFRTKVGYKKNYTVQSDLAAATVSATREFMASEFRSVVAEDLTISSKFLSSIERAQLDSLVTTETNASGINKGLLARYGRQIYSMEFTMLLTDIVKAKLGDPVQVTDYRFNMSGSRLGTISSIEVNYLDGIARVSADFYSYPYINQYFTYQLDSLIEDSTGTSSVVDYDVTIPASGYSIVNAAQYSGIRYFLISPEFTSTGDSVEIIWCKRDSAGLPDITTSYSVKLVKSATPNELTVLTDGVATGTISLSSIPETIQVVYDFDSSRAGLVAFESEDTGANTYYGLACPAGDPSEYYCLAFKNLTPNDLIVSFADTSYYQPRGTRWLQIAKQEVPDYLTLDGLEFEDGTYLLV